MQAPSGPEFRPPELPPNDSPPQKQASAQFKATNALIAVCATTVGVTAISLALFPPAALVALPVMAVTLLAVRSSMNNHTADELEKLKAEQRPGELFDGVKRKDTEETDHLEERNYGSASSAASSLAKPDELTLTSLETGTIFPEDKQAAAENTHERAQEILNLKDFIDNER